VVVPLKPASPGDVAPTDPTCAVVEFPRRLSVVLGIVDPLADVDCWPVTVMLKAAAEDPTEPDRATPLIATCPAFVRPKVPTVAVASAPASDTLTAGETVPTATVATFPDTLSEPLLVKPRVPASPVTALPVVPTELFGVRVFTADVELVPERATITV
jgi:hypothetical protein